MNAERTGLQWNRLMIGYNASSHASGVAFFTPSAQSQINEPTIRRSASNSAAAATTEIARPATSNGACCASIAGFEGVVDDPTKSGGACRRSNGAGLTTIVAEQFFRVVANVQRHIHRARTPRRVE